MSEENLCQHAVNSSVLCFFFTNVNILDLFFNKKWFYKNCSFGRNFIFIIWLLQRLGLFSSPGFQNVTKSKADVIDLTNDAEVFQSSSSSHNSRYNNINTKIQQVGRSNSVFLGHNINKQDLVFRFCNCKKI